MAVKKTQAPLGHRVGHRPSLSLLLVMPALDWSSLRLLFEVTPAGPYIFSHLSRSFLPLEWAW